MATTTVGNVLLSSATLYPPPLLIQKQPRKATFRWRRTRKSSSSQSSSIYPLGPLDDIIAEIKSDIWESPPTCSFGPAWASELGAPSSWATTSLPISSTPRDKPLTIRKNRNSRSTGSVSGSSSNNRALASGARNNRFPLSPHGGTVGPSGLPWAVFPAVSPARQPSAYASLTGVPAVAQAADNQRRPSGFRRFTTSLLQRFQLNESNASTGKHCDGSGSRPHDHHVGDEAIETSIRNDAGLDATSIVNRLRPRFPDLVGHEPDTSGDGMNTHSYEMPTTMRTTVRVIPEKRYLTESMEEIKVAIEVEGVLHNRQAHPDPAIDIIFLVDNGYYVTGACLTAALNAVRSTFYQLRVGDRVALYTTHCNRNTISGIRPELHYAISPVDTAGGAITDRFTRLIDQYGTQQWTPVRPNPPMAEVILCVARSMAGQELKIGRTHIILLSPVPHVFHKVSEKFPDLYVHQINPASLPYYRNTDKRDLLCKSSGSCCENVVVSNLATYQTFPDRIKQIVNNARTKKPLGELKQVSIDVRSREGCEVLEICGDSRIPTLRLGQIHTLFVRIRVERYKAKDVNLQSTDPVLNSGLDVNGLRQKLLSAHSLGAFNVHVLDVRVNHHDALHSHNAWAYVEAPLLLYRTLGCLSAPKCHTLEVNTRYIFHKLTQLSPTTAKEEALNILTSLSDGDRLRPILKKFILEVSRHVVIQEYELNSRQKVPLCPGSVDMEPKSHLWLEDVSRRPVRRRATASAANDEGVDRVIAGIHSLDHLG